MPELTFLATAQLKWIATLIAVDVVLGIIAAVLKKDFHLGKVANFMVKPVLGYVFGYTILDSVAQTLPSLALVVQAAFILIILALVGSILNNLGRLGLSLPDWLKK